MGEVGNLIQEDGDFSLALLDSKACTISLYVLSIHTLASSGTESQSHLIGICSDPFPKDSALRSLAANFFSVNILSVLRVLIRISGD